ncbi:PIG-L family deacetylase [Pseudomonas grimontii]|uniref:PIG-L family deacetylase n=1 Tax=Pseudomonas grimontii TaxID=129847 RepID=UPI00387B4CA7
MGSTPTHPKHVVPRLLLGLLAVALFVIASRLAAQTQYPPDETLIDPSINCEGTRLVSVVAHMDDDLIFIDPAIDQELAKGACVTTVFLNGGSSGAGFEYVIRREAASRKAYARMLGADTAWNTSLIDIGKAKILSVQSSVRPQLRLIFFRLPGGHVRTGDVPLADLFDLDHEVSSWPYTDSATGPTNQYTKDSLTQALTTLFERLNATRVYALNPAAVPYIEHPDHIYSARFAQAALRNLAKDIPVDYYVTYPSAAARFNVEPEAIQRKRDIVATYFYHEGAEPFGTVFREDTWNGNWVGRQIFRSTNAHENTPTPNIPFEPLVNFQTQRCLTASGLNSTLYMDTCELGHSSQNWAFIPSGAKVGNFGTALLKNQSGYCAVLRNETLVGADCASTANTEKQWTPWDFGKIFLPGTGSRCLDARGQSLIGACAPYQGSTLWTRSEANLDKDIRLEVALTGDIAGDGSSRMVQIQRRTNGPGVDIWVSVPQNAQSKLWYESPAVFKPSSLLGSCDDNSICYDNMRILLADFTGDGKDDLMVISPSSDGGTLFRLLKSNGQGFEQPVKWARISEPFFYALAHQYLAGDFYGDGKQHLLIAHTRSDRGVNFWVMKNNGVALNAPVLFTEATGLLKSARLYIANLDGDRFADVIGIDSSGPHVRISTFKSNGGALLADLPTTFESFYFAESKTTVINSPTEHLTQVWVLHARGDSSDINFWKLSNNGSGRFTASSSPVYTESIVNWVDVKPYGVPSGRQILLMYRLNAPVGEYYWRVGQAALKVLNLSEDGVPVDAIDYGPFSHFEWANLLHLERLNTPL